MPAGSPEKASGFTSNIPPGDVKFLSTGDPTVLENPPEVLVRTPTSTKIILVVNQWPQKDKTFTVQWIGLRVKIC